MVIDTSALRRIASGTGNSRGFGATVFLLQLAATTVGHAGTPYQETRPLMGTLVSVTVEGGPADVREKVDTAWREMARLSDMMNHYNPDSVVSEINRQAGLRPVEVPPELMEVLVMARRVSRRTDGAFDITIGAFRGWRFNPENPAMPSRQELAAALPLVDYRNVMLDEKNGTVLLKRPGMRIDLGGIAKLYILNAGMQVLQRHGIGLAMLNGGGDVTVTGTRAGRPWRIGIRHPRRVGELLATVELTRGWVVTSGDYERYFIQDGRRYHHILDAHRFSRYRAAAGHAGGGGAVEPQRVLQRHHGARDGKGPRAAWSSCRGGSPDRRFGRPGLARARVSSAVQTPASRTLRKLRLSPFAVSLSNRERTNRPLFTAFPVRPSTSSGRTGDLIGASLAVIVARRA